MKNRPSKLIQGYDSKLIEGYELGMYLLIRKLVYKYPNDMELGGLIRQVISKKISKESELSMVTV